jgi:4-hydroxy-2-oxoheptanedioate aldolase
MGVAMPLEKILAHQETLSFKQRLKAGQRLVGVRSQICSPIVAEALGFSGFDYVYIDMEHSPNNLMLVLLQCQALAGTPAIPVIRLPTNDIVLIQQLLDIGVENIVVPMVETVAAAAHAASAMRYPPRGIRSVARVHRGNKYGRAADEYDRTVDDRVCFFAQIESRGALNIIADIANVDGVDGVLFGPGDIAADFGHMGQTEHPEVLGAIDEGVRAALATGKLVGMSTADPKFGREWLDKGCQFVSVGGELQMLMKAASLAAVTAGAIAVKTAVSD